MRPLESMRAPNVAEGSAEVNTGFTAELKHDVRVAAAGVRPLFAPTPH